MQVSSTVGSFDGTQIWFSDTGGTGPIAVLLHGLTMTSRTNFETFYALGADGRIGRADGPTISKLLRDAGGRVVGIDARGHGRSQGPVDPERYRGDAHAQDVIAVMDAIGASEAHLVGYSMGSSTAMRVAALDTRVRSLALCGTGISLVEGWADDILALLREVGSCFVNDTWHEHPNLKPYRAFARLDDDHDFAALGAAALGLEPTPSDQLACLKVPVLVLNGGGDDGDDDARRLAAMLPSATPMVVGTADHGMAVSDPEFQNALLDFVVAQWSGGERKQRSAARSASNRTTEPAARSTEAPDWNR